MTRTKNTFLALVAVLLSPLTVNAEVIVISGATNPANDGEWEISFITGNFLSLQEQLANQVWWEDSDLAELFAITLSDQMGRPNNIAGPLFAYSYNFASCQVGIWVDIAGVGVLNTFEQDCAGDFDDVSFTWAIAERVPVSEPSELVGELAIVVTGEGPGRSFADKLMLVQTYLDVPDEESACLLMGDFLNQVRAQRSKKLTEEQADQFTADAVAIMDAIGCD